MHHESSEQMWGTGRPRPSSAALLYERALTQKTSALDFLF